MELVRVAMLSDKSTDHVDTASTCGDCHNPNGWLPEIAYRSHISKWNCAELSC